MHSKHAFILALLAGAGALLLVFAVLIGLSLMQAAAPYLGGQSNQQTRTINTKPPRLTTILVNDLTQIVEIDERDRVTRVLYTSALNDQVADFELLAVPQKNYTGQVYLQAVQDAENTSLIVYPLTVETGKLSPAVINAVSQHATVSPDQTRIVALNTRPTDSFNMYDIATGTALQTWTLELVERLNEKTNASTYTGEGANWTSDDCFEHAVWVDADLESRAFCLEN